MRESPDLCSTKQAFVDGAAYTSRLSLDTLLADVQSANNKKTNWRFQLSGTRFTTHGSWHANCRKAAGIETSALLSPLWVGMPSDN